ncbi:MAG: nucleotidyl transferase AbiEii/AbiGii toxin family protein [Anaerolineae bacterium]
MRYADGGSFRKALEVRLLTLSQNTGLPSVRLRKMVAFERFLARLVVDHPKGWLLKGGLALQWGLGERARTTQDIDVLLLGSTEDVHATLVHAALLDLQDWFRYQVELPSSFTGRNAGGLRFAVHSLLDGRRFESFHVDVGWGDPVIEAPEQLTAPSLLAFAKVAPFVILCYPITQHIAEKLHAYTRPHESGESSRVKDLVDILLIAAMRSMEAGALIVALQATFEARNTHPFPLSFPDPPENWKLPFRRMAREVKLDQDDLALSVEQARRFLEPVLQRQTHGTWKPLLW